VLRQLAESSAGYLLLLLLPVKLLSAGELGHCKPYVMMNLIENSMMTGWLHAHLFPRWKIDINSLYLRIKLLTTGNFERSMVEFGLYCSLNMQCLLLFFELSVASSFGCLGVRSTMPTTGHRYHQVCSY